MPKLKTHKSAAKRFRISGTGKIMRSKQGTSHLRRNKSKSVKRDYDEMIPISKSDVKRIKMSLPYGVK
jgi:large subunit ribosomal protein L35